VQLLLLNAWPHVSTNYAASAHRAGWLIALGVQACVFVRFCRKAPVQMSTFGMQAKLKTFHTVAAKK